ncbi:vinorine synthase-like [Abrus precatorius]|uniref:Vinorine synthase-like n=1 Tax=Abrus precatorius TaxID=3816 RepID=A0A8B8M3A0_ABRPR|nr:vinorine synthase-like [Abrus precatorius]
MEVEIISTQLIKPSCPTPTHPKTHNLSIIDQFMPSIYIPMVLFYPADHIIPSTIDSNITQQRLKQLKESLSQVLTQFYPFAGRIKDKITIDCNDEGVYYTEAKVSCSLVEFFNHANFASFTHKLLPNQTIWDTATEGYPTMIQVTCFACGGMVIGTLISHMIADGAAASFFLSSWGSTSKSEFQHASALPNFDTPFLKNVACPKDTNVMALCGQFLNMGKLAMRRFLFDEEAMSKLKAQGSSLTVQNPTRVEVVTSLLCKCSARAFRENHGLERPSLLTHAVNMRLRASPNFPKSCMGNYVWLALASMGEKEKVIELPELVIKLREALKSINSEFVKSLEGEGGLIKYCEVSKQLIESASNGAQTSGVNYVHYTSWSNFGLYEVDYGWGKPIWVSCTSGSAEDSTLFFNSIILMDTPSSKGIEVWIYLNEDEMSILQQDKELLTFAALDPNPLQLKDYISRA